MKFILNLKLKIIKFIERVKKSNPIQAVQMERL